MIGWRREMDDGSGRKNREIPSSSHPPRIKSWPGKIRSSQGINTAFYERSSKNDTTSPLEPPFDTNHVEYYLSRLLRPGHLLDPFITAMRIKIELLLLIEIEVEDRLEEFTEKVLLSRSKREFDSLDLSHHIDR